MRIEVATGDIDEMEEAFEEPDEHLVTCPERDGACTYSFGPDLASDHDLSRLLSTPWCSVCGGSMVLVDRGSYDGPPHKFRDLGVDA